MGAKDVVRTKSDPGLFRKKNYLRIPLGGRRKSI